jgi:energy-coupling factor transport system permease protein
MQITGRPHPGTYREGLSFLHLFDPRCKLLLLSGLMACLFSATAGWRLLALLLLWLACAKYCTKGWHDGLKVFGMLRWLLLFTLLLHLFFTPGRTLLGTSWLSYDGLVRGLMVDSQLLLAVLFSMLLAWTTRPELLAWGLTSLLSPLQRLNFPVREAGGLLLLVLQFLPMIGDELDILKKERQAVPRRGLAGIKDRAKLVSPLLYSLVDRADRLANEIVSGNDPASTEPPAADRRLSRFDWLLSAAGSGLLLLIWML